MAARARLLLAGYRELAAVVAAVIIGLTVQPPLAWLAAHQGINVLLAILVFATALTVEPAALRRAATAWPSLLAALAAGITVLPALSWAASRLVAAGSLRDGVMAAGLAPCEIASVGTTSMAGGQSAVAAGMLIGSTAATIAVAGPILAIEAGHTGHPAVHPGHIITSLALVVAIPLLTGIALRARIAKAQAHVAQAPVAQPPVAEPPASAGETPASVAGNVERVASATALIAVAVLVALIAAEVRLSVRYLAVALALIVFLAGSALAGWLINIGSRTGRPAAIAVLLTTSMRDFAIAAGLAAAAFGPAAAAPLGVYGILVLVWGTGMAGLLRASTGGRAAPRPADSHIR